MIIMYLDTSSVLDTWDINILPQVWLVFLFA